MLIKVTGSNPTANQLRGLLSSREKDIGKYRLTENAAQFEVVIEESMREETIVCDSIDCPLEASLLEWVNNKIDDDILLRRNKGDVRSRSRIKFIVPAGQEQLSDRLVHGLAAGLIALVDKNPERLISPGWWLRLPWRLGGELVGLIIILTLLFGHLLHGQAVPATCIAGCGGPISHIISAPGAISVRSGTSVDNTAVATGSELITNGTFTGNATGWTLGDEVAYASNHVTSTYMAGDPSITSANFATTSGHNYILTFTISSANNYVYLSWANNSIFGETGPFYNGTYTITFTTDYTGSAEAITFDDYNYQAGDTWILDNVSIKETTTTVSPFHVVGFSGAQGLVVGSDIYGNAGLGASALGAVTTGAFNAALGWRAGSSLTTGTENVAVGSHALAFLTTGSDNAALGPNTLLSLSSGNGNTAVGNSSLVQITSGSTNTAVGTSTLRNLLSGSNNVAIGGAAGYRETGSDKLYIDNQVRASEAAGKTDSLLYGTFSATATDQTLNTPGIFKANQLQAGGTGTPAVGTCGTIGTGSKNNAGFITSGTTGSCVSVLTFDVATAPTGWSCAISNSTTANLIRQTGSSTTTATFTGVTVANDILRYACIAY